MMWIEVVPFYFYIMMGASTFFYPCYVFGGLAGVFFLSFLSLL